MDSLLTEAEAGRELRVSKRTIARERTDGRLDYIRVRGRIFIPADAIESYKQRCRIIASNDAPILRAGMSSGRQAAAATAARRVRRIAASQNYSSPSSDSEPIGRSTPPGKK